jgi:alkanesulfonate monooxygenase SsuD/methylene tetrahydromethanopterin reductase-like flavin-dependent oxidoreductase (luciferase family)
VYVGLFLLPLRHPVPLARQLAASREAARQPLATRMHAYYQMPFEPFERYSPYGTPEQVAEFLRPYIEAGCSAFNLIPCAEDADTAISAVGELRTLLTESPSRSMV